jgi:hypothetical protein
MFLTRGFIFNYEAVRDWEVKLMPALAENLRRRIYGCGAGGALYPVALSISRGWWIGFTVAGHRLLARARKPLLKGRTGCPDHITRLWLWPTYCDDYPSDPKRKMMSAPVGTVLRVGSDQQAEARGK